MSRRWLFWPAPAAGGGGGVLTHLSKTSNAAQNTTSTTAVELTAYTVSWSDITNAGFAAGDEVAIILALKHWNDNNNSNNTVAFTHGTTFAGSVTYDPGGELRAEAPTATAGEQTLWVGQEALVVNENIYVSALCNNAGTVRLNEFVCLIIKLDDLAASDWLYTSVAHTGGATAPTAYDTTGAGTTIPATGDWLLIGGTRFFLTDLTSDMLVAIHDGVVDVAEVRSQAEDAVDRRIVSTMAYRAGLTSGTTVRTRYRAVVGTTIPQLSHTWLFGLRLDAFADHWGATPPTRSRTLLSTPIRSSQATGPFAGRDRPVCRARVADHQRPAVGQAPHRAHPDRW